MSKFVKINNWFYLLAFLFLKPVNGYAQQDCLYKPVPEKFPPGMLSRVLRGEERSYFLKNGTYITVLDWNCRRVGRRILIIVPQKFDDSAYITKLIESQTEKEVIQPIVRLINSNKKNGRFDFILDLDSYEFGSVSINRDTYETAYEVLYYTSD